MIYDGAAIIHDSMTILFRTLADDNVTIKQEVVQFKFLGKSLNGEDLARRLTEVLKDLGVSEDKLRASAHDR